MSPESEAPHSYDQVPYSSYPYANSHPRNLAALATLFDLNPPDVRRCRVLEIGCASGGNLIPMAAGFPESQFLGIDASGRQIQEGEKVVTDLTLDNITLQHQDVLEFESDAGEFDFIICHGVYSWVPPDVQNKILEVCHQHLSANGVAYVSYNTYPGWYLRRGVREMMNYHAEGFDDTQVKIDQSRALVDFLASAVESKADAYESLLQEELNILRSSEDSYIFHEHLEEINEPLFFHQFVARAEEKELRFLCEAQFGSMIPNEYSDKTRKTLAKIAPNIVQMEQYLDFLRNRKFRQTLLCRQRAKPNRVIKPDRLRTLYVSSPLTEQQFEKPSATGPTWVFEHRSGRTLTVGNQIQACALRHLSTIWPSDIAIDALADISREALELEKRPNRDDCQKELHEMLLELYSSSLVALHSTPAGCIPEIGESPRTTNLIRHQANLGNRVTNLRHESVQLDELEREILKRMDGLETLNRITDSLLESGIAIRPDAPDSDSLTGPSAPRHDELRAVVDQKLSRFKRTGLLVQ